MKNRMRELRLKKGISMMEAARRLSMPYTTYVNYEKGNREPNSETLIAIAEFYGVTIDFLLGKPVSSGSLFDSLDLQLFSDSEPAPAVSRPVSDDDIKFALFGGAENITDEMYDEVKRFAAYIKSRETK